MRSAELTREGAQAGRRRTTLRNSTVALGEAVKKSMFWPLPYLQARECRQRGPISDKPNAGKWGPFMQLSCSQGRFMAACWPVNAGTGIGCSPLASRLQAKGHPGM